jgi:hypothetical protein
MIKLMKIFNILLLVLPFFSIFSLQVITQQVSQACSAPTARVISRNHPIYRIGSLLCSKKPPKLTNRVPLEIVCLNSARAITVRGPEDYLLCQSVGNRSKIPPTNPSFLTRNDSTNKPVINLPIGVAVRDLSIDLQWSAVLGAQSYQITLDEGESWKNYKSDRNQLFLDSLSPGKTYKIAIRAYSGSTLISKYTSTLKVLPEYQRRNIAELFKAIEAQPMPQEDLLFVKIGILDKFELNSESISLSTQFMSKNVNNPRIARVTGDLYASISRFRQAIKYYNQYLSIAQRMQQREYITDAKERIQYVSSLMQSVP